MGWMRKDETHREFSFLPPTKRIIIIFIIEIIALNLRYFTPYNYASFFVG